MFTSTWTAIHHPTADTNNVPQKMWKRSAYKNEYGMLIDI